MKTPEHSGAVKQDIADFGIIPDEEQLLSFREICLLSSDKQNIVRHYLSKQSPSHLDDTNYLAKQIHNPLVPLARTVVPIPVAAHQEALNIEHSLSLYAKQKTQKPFTVILYPNAPEHIASEATKPVFDALERSKDLFPSLDFRYTDLEQFEDPIIGKIRKNIWDAVLLLGYHEKIYDDPDADIIGINHDIDTVSMSPRYIQRVDSYYENLRASRKKNLLMTRSPLPPTQTVIKHAMDPERPNLSKALFWYEMSRRQLGSLALTDEGTVIPMSYYADNNGFDPKARLSEAIELTRKGVRTKIPLTNMETSPRRYADRLHVADYKSVWTEETFGAEDQCRTNPSSDISAQRLQTLMLDSLPQIIPRFFLRIAEEFWIKNRLLGNKDVKKVLDIPLRNKRLLALAVLDRIDNTGELSSSADAMININEMVQDIRRCRDPKIFRGL